MYLKYLYILQVFKYIYIYIHVYIKYINILNTYMYTYIYI